MYEFEKSPVFFIFINPLKVIAENIKNKSYDEAFIKIFILQKKLTSPDLEPFPDYNEILNKLDISNVLENLKENLIISHQQSIPSCDLNGNINKLMMSAHMINFLERIKNKKTEFKERIGIVWKYFFGYDITKADRLTSDCKSHLMWAKTRNYSFTNFEYEKIISLTRYFNSENFQEFSHYLFANMDIPSNAQVYDYLDLTQHNIFDQKYALLKFSIEASNNYKEAYKWFIQRKIAQQAEEIDQENSSKTFIY